jgi:hypothetical protein
MEQVTQLAMSNLAARYGLSGAELERRLRLAMATEPEEIRQVNVEEYALAKHNFVQSLLQLQSLLDVKIPDDVSLCLDRAELIAESLEERRRKHLRGCAICMWRLLKMPTKSDCC